MTGNRQRSPALLWLITGILAIVLGIAGCDFTPPPPRAHTDLEIQGRHVLQIAAGCGCHGPNFAGWRSGGPDTLPRTSPYGERFIGPFGVVPAANITQDSTGIGGWSDDQIARAITDGIDPSGARLSPLMPYQAYHGMSHGDVKALVAYLHRIAPVHNVVPDSQLKEPVPESGTWPAPPDIRPAGGVELGRYLVRNISACADCHGSGSPAPEGEALTGKTLHMGSHDILAPNLTSDKKTGIGSWSEADIARYLRSGSRPDGGLAHSVMAGLILTSFSHYTSEEAHAVAAYLKSLPPVR